MKKLVIFGVVMIMVLGLCGCNEDSEDETENKVNVDKAVSWDEMIPDYTKIFKNGNITTKYATGTTKDDVAGAYFVIENVTQGEYETYIKEASKRYPNVISQSFDTTGEEPYAVFYANDDAVKHSVLIILDVDPFSEKLTCSITCETCSDVNSNNVKEEEQ